ncbi:uncharacterized protein V6R79_003124 [Siganus canaliculatus]
MESIPLELSRYMGKSEEDGFLSSKTSLSCNLPNNILTPDKIPEFCLPPRLCRRSPQPETDTIAANLDRQHQIFQSPKSRPSSGSLNAKVKEVKMKNGDALVTRKAQRKPLPFSAELYGLTGIYESPNTRRKESLFLSKRPVYTFDRNLATSAPRQVKETNRPKKTPAGFLPSILCKSLLEIGGTDNETPSSSSDSSPFRSPQGIASPPYMQLGSSRMKGATSCPSLNDSRVEKEKWKSSTSCLTTSPSCPPSLEGSSNTLAPPVYFPVEVLQCQERHQREHVLPLQGRGKVRVFAEYTTMSTTLRSLFTVRVRLVSVEDLWDDADKQTLNCAVNLCLIPGKLQQQNSATIRNCRSPVFNEDFFFTELSRENVLELQLRLRVVNKPAAATLRKGTVIGVTSKPLSELINFNKGEKNI